MKTVIAFAPFISRMIEVSYDLPRVLGSCQSAANDTTGREGETKRSAFNPKAKGMEIHWKESTAMEYAASANAPLRMVAWADAMTKLAKLHGEPSGELTPECIPDGLKIWLETKFKKPVVQAPAPEDKAPEGQTPAPENADKAPDAPEDKSNGNGRRNGNVGKVKTPEPAK